MYEAKFKTGDVIIPSEGKINFYQYELNDSFIIIDDVIQINSTSYYQLNGDYNDGMGDDLKNPLFPSITIDDAYKLDEIYLRKQKLDKLIYKTKIK